MEDVHMLIVKNLKKTYKTKGGVAVHALDDVSVTFPENGLVFLLGKSGSGKSTLLNMIGGLDRVDSGEIIVKGKNSKTFSGADYDSYRNTYIGFIFQEYNILNEFNVEQNISLALQLQGKPNDKKAVEAILEQVDLAGLGKRKPNTLSGGQKQRVAIARALIKNPEIIMADEPTGALDSTTGKQVFETLKKLSKDKLVIVVSHDRDFAEFYGDRIIELSDGKIISDTTKEFIEPQAISENVHIVNDHTIAIKDTSKLTENDMKEILKALKNEEGEAVISSGEHDLKNIKQVIHLTDDNASEVFNETKEVETKEYDPKKTKFIRSKLPLSRAFKMGSSSLKLKPVRLIFTTLLTSIALAMFGLASTLMLFKESYSISQALQKSDYNSEMVIKYYDYTNRNFNLDVETGSITGDRSYHNTRNTYFDNNDINELNNNSAGHYYAGLITFNSGSEYGKNSNAGGFSLKDVSKTNEFYYYYGIFAFSDAGEDYFNHTNLEIIAGTYPTAANELLISNYHYAILQLTSDDVNDYGDILGKEYTINLNGNRNSTSTKMVIKGVYNAGEMPSKFTPLKNDTSSMNRNELAELKEELSNYLVNSFQTIAFVSNDFFDAYKDSIFTANYTSYNNIRLDLKGVCIEGNPIDDKTTISPKSSISVTTDKVYQYAQKPQLYNLEGEEIAYKAPVDNEMYISYNQYTSAKHEQDRAYFRSLRRIMECLEYDEEAYNTLSAHREDYQDISQYLENSVYDKYYYPEERNYQEDKAFADSIIEQYFDKTVQRQYIFDLGQKLINGFGCEHGYGYYDESLYPEYVNFYNKFNNARNTTPYNMSDYEEIKDYVLKDEDHYLKHYLLYSYADYYHQDNVDMNMVDDIRNRYQSQMEVSEKEWEFLEDFINTYVHLSEYDSTTPSLDLVKSRPALEISRQYYKTYTGQTGMFKVVGFVINDRYFINHDFASSIGTFEQTNIYINEEITDYQITNNPKYSYAITHTSFTQNQVDDLLKKGSNYGYKMTDDVYRNLQMMLSLISTLKQVFLIAGIVFGVFAALMLFNFISTSIAAKTKEIGILRAVGARGNDLFKIFFSESGLIALICSIIAIAASIVVCWRLNVMMMEKVGLSMLNFGLINVGLILAGAVAIAIIGTLIPVIIAAKKPPVESIRTL